MDMSCICVDVSSLQCKQLQDILLWGDRGRIPGVAETTELPDELIANAKKARVSAIRFFGDDAASSTIEEMQSLMKNTKTR